MLAPKIFQAELIAHWLTDLCTCNVWATASITFGPTYALEYSEENGNDFKTMLVSKMYSQNEARCKIFLHGGEGLVIQGVPKKLCPVCLKIATKQQKILPNLFHDVIPQMFN